MRWHRLFQSIVLTQRYVNLRIQITSRRDFSDEAMCLTLIALLGNRITKVSPINRYLKC